MGNAASMSVGEIASRLAVECGPCSSPTFGHTNLLLETPDALKKRLQNEYCRVEKVDGQAAAYEHIKAEYIQWRQQHCQQQLEDAITVKPGPRSRNLPPKASPVLKKELSERGRHILSQILGGVGSGLGISPKEEKSSDNPSSDEDPMGAARASESKHGPREYFF